jgi:hypothetical protein
MLGDLGAGIGSSVGRVLIGAFGKRVVFRILGVIAFLTGFLYFLFNIFYLRPKANEKITLPLTRLIQV